jgi:hypothetical protein
MSLQGVAESGSDTTELENARVLAKWIKLSITTVAYISTSLCIQAGLQCLLSDVLVASKILIG